MEKVEVHLEPTPNFYKVIRTSDGRWIKTVRVVYVADLIEKNGLFFRCVKNKALTKVEKFLLAEHHYQKKAVELLDSKGQTEMADKIRRDVIVAKRMVYVGEGHTMYKSYSVIFSSGLEINVEDLHYRLFAIKPDYNIKQTAIQKSLEL